MLVVAAAASVVGAFGAVVTLPSGAEAAAVCNGLAVTVDLNIGESPTSGDDVILGTPDDDAINAGAGDDVVCGEGGDDTILGQDGNDVVFGGPGADVLSGNSGNDQLDGGPGFDRVYGGSGNDSVDGGSAADLVGGSSGVDTIRGGDGNDFVFGGSGADAEVSGGQGDDVVNGGGGPDLQVRGGDGNDAVSGNGGNDIVRGDAGNDEVRGGNGNDQVFGGGGDDFLAGNKGTDVCDGGTTDETIGDTAASNCETVVNVQPPGGCRAEATICIGAGETYTTFSAGVAAATEGAIIEVKAGTYNDTAPVTVDDVTIRAAPGPKPTIDCSGMRPAWGQACILAVGTNLTVEDLRVTGAAWTSGNEACFRNLPDTTVTIRRIECFDALNGILGSGGSWLVEDSTFTNNGNADGFTHNLYFSGACTEVIVRNVNSSVPNGGHAFKSRCATSIIEDSTIIENTVADGADFSDGGVAVIRNTYMEQPDGSNGNIIRHGSESCSNPGSLTIEDSTIVSGRTPSYILSNCASITIVNTSLPTGVIIQEP